MRKTDLDALYQILDGYEQRRDRKISLAELSRTHSPRWGCCFFYEKGEYREESGAPRIVRVESYPRLEAKTDMYSQLILHRGTIAGVFTGGGNHRLSLLRKHIGTAMMNRMQISCESWEDEQFNASVRKLEHPLEVRVSEVISRMEVLMISFEDNDIEKQALRYIQKNAVALLSNWQKEVLDPPSPDWMGKFCSNVLVRDSGLWNTNGVMQRYDSSFIPKFKKIIEQSK